MPGAYAHLTLVGLLTASNVLNKEPGFPQAAKADLLANSCFCDLGAVSPDYPYLHLAHAGSAAWADLMHYTNTGKMLDVGVQEVRKLSGNAKKSMFAWLLGYAAHVVTDTTIHPVVEMKVGPYAQNKTAHRVCEMHQDAYIFQRLNVGAVGLSEYLDSGICLCSSQSDEKKLNKEVATIWRTMLRSCHPEEYQKNLPAPDSWHAAFLSTMDLAEEGQKLFPFSRHVAVNAGVTYPNVKDIDRQYVRQLNTPDGTMDYDAVFDRAKANVLRVWAALASAVYNSDASYQALIGDWNLDTGRDNQNELAFWSRVA
ncbi:zinc dependent phospholipase C family protein [Desulfobulbus sp.]|uniref:zinc dependent phospholipase C family protein n=1 Tax=Desulfobulbus sp. TaxID=895 RepID=UPI00286EE4E3|nr:zinc dependent phospholipase C family protein [Desulfobulbus sp.]